MFICNKRKGCEVKGSCPHATKHLKTEKCHSRPDNCPFYAHGRARRICKPVKTSKGKLASILKQTNHKVRVPITQEEANRALINFRNLVLVEKRMAGESVTTKLKLDELENGIGGISKEYNNMLFPDATQRGLNRVHIRMALFDEITRIRKLRGSRYVNKNRHKPERTLSERTFTLSCQRQEFFRTTMRNNYTCLSDFWCDVQLTNSQSKPELVVHKSANRRSRHSSFVIILPKGKVIRSAKWYEGGERVIVCDYKDKDKQAFVAHVVVGKKHDMSLIETVISNGRIATDVEKEHKKIKKERREQK